MVIASDGLWDCVNDQEAVDVVKDTLSLTHNRMDTSALSAAATALMSQALYSEVGDNVTVMVVGLQWTVGSVLLTPCL